MEAWLPEAVGDEVDDGLFHLQGPGDAEEGSGLGRGGVPLKNVRPEDEVDEAGFVLQGHEGDTGGGTGMIAHGFLILQIRNRVL